MDEAAKEKAAKLLRNLKKRAEKDGLSTSLLDGWQAVISGANEVTSQFKRMRPLIPVPRPTSTGGLRSKARGTSECLKRRDRSASQP